MTIAEEVQKLWDFNKACFPTPPRKIQIQRAGSHYKARWAGRPNFTFGPNPAVAEKLLRHWGDNGLATNFTSQKDKGENY